MKYKSIIIVIVVLVLAYIGLDVYRNLSSYETVKKLNKPEELFEYLLESNDPYVARNIFIKLGDIDSSDVDKILRELAYEGVEHEESRIYELLENPVVKVSLARALISRGIHNDDVKKYLIHYAVDQNRIIRSDVAHTLRYIATTNSLQILSKLAKDKDIVVFSESIRSLIYLYDKRYEQEEIENIFRDVKLQTTDKRRQENLLDYEKLFTTITNKTPTMEATK